MHLPQWSEMRGRLLPSTISTLSTGPIRAWTQKTRPGNIMFLPVSALSWSSSAYLFCSFSVGFLLHRRIRLISPRGLTWPSDWGITRPKPQPLMEQRVGQRGDTNWIEARSIWQASVWLFYRAFTSPNLEGGPCNDVSVLSEAQLSTDVSGVRRAGEALKPEDEIPLWQEQEARWGWECSSFLNPIVRRHCRSLPRDHGQTQPASLISPVITWTATWSPSSMQPVRLDGLLVGVSHTWKISTMPRVFEVVQLFLESWHRPRMGGRKHSQ